MACHILQHRVLTKLAMKMLRDLASAFSCGQHSEGLGVPLGALRGLGLQSWVRAHNRTKQRILTDGFIRDVYDAAYKTPRPCAHPCCDQKCALPKARNGTPVIGASSLGAATCYTGT
jgi:hypothetical protein